jgi:hypothetical protein
MLGQIELDAIVSELATSDASASITPTLHRDEVFEFAFDVILQGLRGRLKSSRDQ